MTDQNIPGTLKNRVMNFYEFIWNKNKWVKLISNNFSEVYQQLTL